MNHSGIIIVGLGPGNPRLITKEALDVIENASDIYLRTIQHPALGIFPPSVNIHSYDYLYEKHDSFDSVYKAIVEEVISLGSREEGVIYGVPGHPFVAESTCPEIVRQARSKNIPVQIIDGISFIEPVISALGVDLFPHTSMVDALSLMNLYHPPFAPDHPVLITQIYDAYIASEVKLTLLNQYPEKHLVNLIHFAGTDQATIEEVFLFEIDRSHQTGHMTVLYIPILEEYTAFENLQEITARLRAPEGCPWDQEQTLKSMRPHLLEETYELLDAIDEGAPGEIREEIGDLLLILTMLIQIGTENRDFSSADVIKGISRKLIYRHPHVFSGLEVDGSETVLKNWELLKANEKDSDTKNGEFLLDGVPITLPALTQAIEYQERASHVGFDWLDIEGVLEKVNEELLEIEKVNDENSFKSELGDLLFTIANYFRWKKIDAESALREANHRFRKRFSYIEKVSQERDLKISEMSADELNQLWEEAKKEYSS